MTEVPALSLDARCPACGYMHLVADSDGVITCSWDECPQPTLVAELLGQRDLHVHLIRFDEDGFVVQHPLSERLRPGGLFACDIGAQLRALSGPPGIGMFRVQPGGSLDDAEQVDEADVDFEDPSTPPSPEVTQESLLSAIPIGTLVAIPKSMPIPDHFIVAEPQMRLPVAAYPVLAEEMIGKGYEPFEDEGLLVVGIDCPPDADPGPSARLVLRIS